MNQPARAFMTLEEWQKRQLEAVVFCYDLLKEQGLLKGFSCIGDTRAYTETFVRLGCCRGMTGVGVVVGWMTCGQGSAAFAC